MNALAVMDSSELTLDKKKINATAKRFLVEDAIDIVGMDLERQAIDITMKTGIPTILIGHTGTAKTTLMQTMHHEQGWPYRSVTMNGAVEVDSLVGKWIVTKDGMEYKLGILPFCMKHGIALGVQEINFAPPEVLVLLHELVDEGHITLTELDPEHEDFVIEPHPNFRLYGTMNPPEMYAGARDLSPALARRCIVRSVQSLTHEQEISVVSNQVDGVSEHVITQLVAVGDSIRESFNQGRTMYYLSTADLVMWARLVQHGLKPYEAGELAVIGKTNESDRHFVRSRIRLEFDPNYDGQ